MLALLHTSPVHVPVFDALRDHHHPGLRLRHTVDEELLARARSHGPEAVAGAVRAALAEALSGGAGAVLCTCSTIGAVAERWAAEVGAPVLRVDRPMAAAAAAAAHRRIAVVATVESTLAPTVALLGEELAREEPEDGGRTGERAASEGSGRIRTHLAEGAWERFASGDHDGYLDAVAAALDAVRDADVIVLAQVSMAAAVARATTSVPVLSSPRPGLAAAARVVEGGVVETEHEAPPVAQALAPGAAGR
ncbi:hypothetical protein ACFVY9_29770 [Streptomyces sp. NPDC059544]|uniref:hypothetical protein n=1 Tax=Streptomyces sp. NPDC059544 TaxID=3346861 RepID=UPI00369E5803